jgi:3-deoxy-D-manno-octulosonate 8-phosphate phosphatase (KDO 8-P phosphatase)
VSVFDAAIAKRIRLIGFDVDGVLTENDVWIGGTAEHREEFKRFDIQDGFGIRLLRDSNITVAWVTGRVSPPTLLRATELRVPHVVTVNANNKVPAFAALLGELKIAWDEVAFVGDDIPDMPVLQRVALPIAVANARDEVKAVAKYVTDARGGHGAVREAIDRLLKSRGEFDAAVAKFFAGGETPT